MRMLPFAAMCAVVLSAQVMAIPTTAGLSNEAVQVAQMNTCGHGAWTIADLKNDTTLFNGLASCTTVDSSQNVRIILRGFVLNIAYQPSSEMTCGPSQRLTVDLEPGQYHAGYGNPPPPGSSCSFDIDTLPNQAALVRGGLTATLGACSHVGGCAHPSDWDLVSVKGSFEAYYSGP
jgi:hypothetical protein